MKAIKDMFDPKGILNPYKVLDWKLNLLYIYRIIVKLILV